MQATAQQLQSPREVLDGGMIKGGMMSAHVGWATSGREPAEVDRFWKALPPHLQELLGGMLLNVSWYEFAHLIEVDRAIVKLFGRGNPSVLREVGGHSARLNLTGVYKVYRRDSIHAFLDNGARLHSKFQDFGDAAYIMTGPSSGQMVHSGYRSYSPLFCESAFGYYRESLLLHGARSVQVDETTCQCRGARSCTFAIHWR